MFLNCNDVKLMLLNRYKSLSLARCGVTSSSVMLCCDGGRGLFGGNYALGHTEGHAYKREDGRVGGNDTTLQCRPEGGSSGYIYALDVRAAGMRDVGLACRQTSGRAGERSTDRWACEHADGRTRGLAVENRRKGGYEDGRVNGRADGGTTCGRVDGWTGACTGVIMFVHVL